MGEQCERCRGLFEPLSRQATQNAMGPWQVRNERSPFGPGCSYEKLREMVVKGRISRSTILRGPSTRQFWSLACNTPGVAVLLGECHNCHSSVKADEYLCRTCGALLTCSSDRQFLGLGPVKLLPGEAGAAEVASSAMGRVERPATPTGTIERIASRPREAEYDAPVGPRSAAPAARRRARRREETSRVIVVGVIAALVIIVTIAAVAAMSRSRGEAGAAEVSR
jgi:hypothetical protein